MAAIVGGTATGVMAILPMLLAGACNIPHGGHVECGCAVGLIPITESRRIANTDAAIFAAVSAALFGSVAHSHVPPDMNNGQQGETYALG